MFHVEHLLADINHDWVLHVEHGEALFHMKRCLARATPFLGECLWFPSQTGLRYRSLRNVPRGTRVTAMLRPYAEQRNPKL